VQQGESTHDSESTFTNHKTRVRQQPEIVDVGRAYWLQPEPVGQRVRDLRIEAYELCVLGDLHLGELSACQWLPLYRFGQSPRHQETGKRLDDVIAQPATKLVVQSMNDRWMKGGISLGVRAPSAGHLRPKHMLGHPNQVAISAVRRFLPRPLFTAGSMIPLA